MGEYLVPVIVALASTAATATSSAVSAHQQEVKASQEARETRAEARAEAARVAEENKAGWQSMTYPKPEVVEAQATQNRGQLAQARLGSYQNLASNLAARGFGSGSGLGARGAANIERGYLQNLGQSATELTKFQNTPQFGPPGSAYNQYSYMAKPSVGTTPLGAGMSTAGSLMNQAYGWTMMKNLYGTQQPTTGPSSYYNPYNYGTNYAYNYGPSYTG